MKLFPVLFVIACTTPSEPDPGPSRDVAWPPRPGVAWQIQLLGTIDPSVPADVYVIDLFDAPQATIDELHAAGRRVICYFSAGSFEDWREDAAAWPRAAIGMPLDGWPGEYWIDTRSAAARAVLLGRLDLAASKGVRRRGPR